MSTESTEITTAGSGVADPEAAQALLAKLRKLRKRAKARHIDERPVQEHRQVRREIDVNDAAVRELEARKKADLEMLGVKVAEMREAFEQFQNSTGLLPKELRAEVNDFEGFFVVRQRRLRELFEQVEEGIKEER